MQLPLQSNCLRATLFHWLGDVFAEVERSCTLPESYVGCVCCPRNVVSGLGNAFRLACVSCAFRSRSSHAHSDPPRSRWQVSRIRTTVRPSDWYCMLLSLLVFFSPHSVSHSRHSHTCCVVLYGSRTIPQMYTEEEVFEFLGSSTNFVLVHNGLSKHSHVAVCLICTLDGQTVKIFA